MLGSHPKFVRTHCERGPVIFKGAWIFLKLSSKFFGEYCMASLAGSQFPNRELNPGPGNESPDL